MESSRFLEDLAIAILAAALGGAFVETALRELHVSETDIGIVIRAQREAISLGRSY